MYSPRKLFTDAVGARRSERQPVADRPALRGGGACVVLRKTVLGCLICVEIAFGGCFLVVGDVYVFEGRTS